MTYATGSSASGRCGRVGSDACNSTSRSSTKTWRSGRPALSSALSREVSRIWTPASAVMYSMRSRGALASIGTYRAPALSAPTMATYMGVDRSMRMPTAEPGPTPNPRS